MRKLISRKPVLSIIVTEVFSTENIDDRPPTQKNRSSLTAQDGEHLENDFFPLLSSLTGYRETDSVIWLVPTSHVFSWEENMLRNSKTLKEKVQ